MGAAIVAQEPPADSPKIEAAGKQWLAVMNKDKDNTVDKKEFLDYMEKEFTKADTDHDNPRRPGVGSVANETVRPLATE